MVVTTLKNGKRMVMALLRENLSDRELEILGLLREGAADKEIAARLHLSLNTVKWHNRQIYAKLGVNNRTQAVSGAEKLGLLSEPATQGIPTPQIPNNLPAPLSSFVGREQEIEDIKTLLEFHRLVTLTGPGGVGKTRLALEVARELLQRGVFGDGIHFVELAPVVDPERVLTGISESLNLKPQVEEPLVEILKRFFSDRQMLLVMDNFEHLLEAAPLVSDLLAGASNLNMLATSREPLHLSGEQLYAVQPLEIHPSQQLFVQRAREVKPDFEPGKEDLELIDRVCARLDRLPLAIELAAARMNHFTPGRLLDSLEERFQILTDGPRDAPERHQSLWDAIDWSYNLLEEEEQILFRRLAVFQGGHSLSAVKAICFHDLESILMKIIGSLQEKNLIHQDRPSREEPRFTMLETIKECSKSKLTESDDLDRLHRSHALFYLSQVEERTGHDYSTGKRIRWLEQMNADYENIRAAFTWAKDEKDYEIGLRLVAGLTSYWTQQGNYRDCRKWTELSLEWVEYVTPEIQADIYMAAGVLYYRINKIKKSTLYFFKALMLYLEQGNKLKLAYVHNNLIGNEIGIHERDEYVRYHSQKAISLFEEIEYKPGLHAALTDFGVHKAFLGEYHGARNLYTRALALAREIGDEIKESVNLINLSILTLREGDPLAAESLLKNSISLLRSVDYQSPYLTAGPLSYIACIAVDLDQIEKAVILFSASEALYSKNDFSPLPESKPFFKQYKDKAASLMSRAEFDSAQLIGQHLTPEQAVAYALDEISLQ
jgi:predicted ATPase/DNA-binding CsgD family transcriptional regulator